MRPTLPFELGGVGFRKATRVSCPGHWASWADCLPMIHVRWKCGQCSTKQSEHSCFPRAALCVGSRSLVSRPPRKHDLIPSRFASCCCASLFHSPRVLVDVAVFSTPVAIIAQRAHEWEFLADGASTRAATVSKAKPRLPRIPDDGHGSREDGAISRGQVWFFLLFCGCRVQGLCQQRESVAVGINWTSPTGWVQILRGPRPKVEKWPAASAKNQRSPGRRVPTYQCGPQLSRGQPFSTPPLRQVSNLREKVAAKWRSGCRSTLVKPP